MKESSLESIENPENIPNKNALEKRNFESLISQNLFKARIIKKDNNAVSIPLNKNCPNVGKEITQKIEIYRGNNGNRNLWRSLKEQKKNKIIKKILSIKDDLIKFSPSKNTDRNTKTNCHKGWKPFVFSRPSKEKYPIFQNWFAIFK